MNSVKLKKLCFGALLNPAAWGCAAFDHQVIGGWVAVLLFCIIGWFNVALGVALCVVGFMLHLIVFPIAEYKIQMSDKVLSILLFNSDFHRRYRNDFRRKMSIVRIIASHSDGHDEIIWSGKEVFGCDVRFIDAGIFLFKPHFAFWGIICDGYEYGKDLGWRVADLIFDEKTSRSKKSLHFLMGNGFISLNVDGYDKDSIFTYFFQTAKYKPLNSDMPIHVVLGRIFQHLLCTIDGKNYLIGFHLNEDDIPMAYIIIAPTIIWKHNGKDIAIHADEDGAFQLPKH